MVRFSIRGYPALFALAAAGFLIGMPDVRAQTTDAPPKPNTEHPQQIPQSPPGPVRNDTPESLTQKLDQSQGVITPPKHVDPEMQKPAPDVGPQSTPVIPPPGTPNNNPGVQPK
jgi:hypothetical protein